MRRTDREVTDPNQLLDIIRRCQVCRLALFDQEYPYLIPMNFGYEYRDDQLTLYFHTAGTGKKLDLLRANPRAAFEMDLPGRICGRDTACSYTMEFESIAGCGRIRLVTDRDGKLSALRALMRQYTAQELPFSPQMVDKTTILELQVERLTGKRHLLSGSPSGPS